MRRIEELAVTMMTAIVDRLTFTVHNLSNINVTASPVAFSFSMISLTLLLIIIISSSSVLLLYSPLLSTIHAQEPSNTQLFLTLPNDMVVEAASNEGTEVRYTVSAGNATLEEDGFTIIVYDDFVGGEIDIFCDPHSGSIFPIDTTTVQCSAEDSYGNTEEGVFLITVEDTTPPVITVPDNMIEEATSSDGTQVSFEVSAVDAVDGVVDVICNYRSGATFPIDTTTVQCSATDEAGNTGVQDFLITVEAITTGEGGGEDIGTPLSPPLPSPPVGEGGEEIPQPPLLQPAPLQFDSGEEIPRQEGSLLSSATVIPLIVVLVGIIVGGIAIGKKYKMNQTSSRRIEIPPSASVEIRTKGGMST